MTEKEKKDVKGSLLKSTMVLGTLLGTGTILVATLTYVIESHDMASRAEAALVQKAEKKDLDRLETTFNEFKARQEKVNDELYYGNDITVRHFGKKIKSKKHPTME